MAADQQVGRHFEQEVADEEDTGTQAVHGVGKPQIRLHLQLGKADVHPVQVCHHVAQEQEGQQALADARIQLFGSDHSCCISN
jgi:hypothetical protein